MRITSKVSDVHYVGAQRFRVERVKVMEKPPVYQAVIYREGYWHTIAVGKTSAQAVDAARGKLTTMIGVGV